MAATHDAHRRLATALTPATRPRVTARQGLAIHTGLAVSAACLLLLINLWRDPVHLWFWRPLLVWGVLLALHAVAHAVRAARPLVAGTAAATERDVSRTQSPSMTITWRDALQTGTAAVLRSSDFANRLLRRGAADAARHTRVLVARADPGSRARLAGRWLRGDDLTSNPGAVAAPDGHQGSIHAQPVNPNGHAWSGASWTAALPVVPPAQGRPVIGDSAAPSASPVPDPDPTNDLPDGWTIARAWMVAGQPAHGPSESPWAPPRTSSARQVQGTQRATAVHASGNDTVVSAPRPHRLVDTATSKNEEWAWLEAAAEAWLESRAEASPSPTRPLTGGSEQIAAVS